MADTSNTNTESPAPEAATDMPGRLLQDTATVAPHPQRPLSSTSMSSPVFVSSRPASPSSIGRPSPSIRRPSSSMSTSSRRASLLSPPDPHMPQRFPRSPPADAAAFAELHQELEAEQEAQVNRLLNLIRIQNLQSGGSIDGDANSNAATVDSSSTRAGHLSRRSSNRFSRDGSYYHPRSMSRASSPGAPLGPDSASESSVWIGSHDASFHAAESQMLKRENEMLKRRIRELEKIVADLSAKATASSTSAEAAPVVPLVPVSSESEAAGPSATAS